MTVNLDWPPDVVERLKKQAFQRGLSLDAFLLEAVLQRSKESPHPGGGNDNRSRRQGAAARILEIQGRVQPDPEGWTSRDYINFGRR
jgi:hypothetical protein